VKNSGFNRVCSLLSCSTPSLWSGLLDRASTFFILVKWLAYTEEYNTWDQVTLKMPKKLSRIFIDSILPPHAKSNPFPFSHSALSSTTPKPHLDVHRNSISIMSKRVCFTRRESLRGSSVMRAIFPFFFILYLITSYLIYHGGYLFTLLLST
jgi:hypothetical protein